MVDAMVPVLNPATVRRDPGLRPARHRHVALFRRLGGAEMRARHGREHGLGRRRPAAPHDRGARRPHAAAGRPQPALARQRHRPDHGAGAGGAPPRPQAGGGQGLRAGERDRPGGDGRRARPLRRDHHGQVLAGSGGRIRFAGDRRGGRPSAGPARLQGRHELAARAADARACGRGPRSRDGRRGEAAADRGSGEGTALWQRPGAPHHRQARRAGRTAASPRTAPSRRTRWPSPSAAGCWSATTIPCCGPAWPRSKPPSAPRVRFSRPWCACPISAPAVRTTPRPGCRKAARRWPASAATS